MHDVRPDTVVFSNRAGVRMTNVNAYTTLLVERAGDVLTLTLNRPERLNALSRTMVDELRELFQSLYWDRTVRVVVISRMQARETGLPQPVHFWTSNGPLLRSMSRCDAARSPSSVWSRGPPAAAAWRSPWPRTYVFWLQVPE